MPEPTLESRQALAKRVAGALKPGQLFIDNTWFMRS